jgi:hypothetical protein
MKKLITAFGLLGCVVLPGLAHAQSGTCNPVAGSHVQYSQSQATNLLRGSLACYPTVAPFTNQEAHYTSGILGDYKKGPAGPGVVDPTLTNIGGWVIDGTGKVTYTYSPGGTTFSYIVFGGNITNPGSGTYDFCTTVGATPIRIRVVKTSTGPC